MSYKDKYLLYISNIHSLIDVIYINSLLDWTEGQYIFHFLNDKKTEQYYFEKWRRITKYQGVYQEKELEKLVKDYWCSPKQPPITDGLETLEVSEKNETVWKWDSPETRYNDEFRLCLDYHDNNNTGLKNFATDISCRVDTFYYVPRRAKTCDNVELLKDNMANCDFKWDSGLKVGSLLIRPNLTHESLKHEKVEIKLPMLNITKSNIIINLMCFIKDTSDYGHKYVFNQPVMITLPTKVQETPHTPSTITFVTQRNVTENVTSTVRWARSTKTSSGNIHSAQSDTSLVVLAIIFLFLLIVGITLVIRYHKKRSKRYKQTGLDVWKISPSTTEMNPLYHTDESDNEEENNNKEAIIPKWLTKKPEMIYQPQCIEQGQVLGHGQYGTVYKGKLNQGHAV